jgi:F-type H+-transporting ATPase subunit beta
VVALGSHLVETGIKALDLLAPLAAGAIVRTCFEPGQGAIVLLGEVSLRWWRRTASSAPAVVWVGWERQPSDRGEIEAAFAELDLDAAARLVWSPASDDADQRRGTLDAALDEALRLQGAGALDVLVVVFARRGFGAEVDAALPRIGRRDGRSITLIVAERDGDPAGDGGPLTPPFDACIAFDSRLASNQHFPAVDPLASRSGAEVDAEHARIADEARTLLARYRELVPDLGEGDPARLAEAEQELVGRARRLQAYLTQPFLSAEAFSGEPGSVVPLAGTLEDVARILAGELDGTDLAQIGFRGRLD